MKKRLVLLALTFLLIFATIAIAADSKPVIAVKTFENPPNYYNSTIGNGLTDLFITELQKTGHYKIIERAHVRELTDEVDFGKSGYVEQKSAVRKGHIKGVQYYFFAKVTNFGAEKKKIGGGGWGGRIFGGLGVKKKKAYVRIDFRIVDATSGETVYADYGEGKYSKSGISFGGGRWGSGGGSLDVSSDEFLASMVGHATMLALQNIIDKMDHTFLEKHKSRAEELQDEEAKAQKEALKALRKVPGKVMAVVSKDLIIISLGNANGVRVGDILNVFRTDEIKNSKGEVVYSEEKQIGTIQVYEVQNDRSKAKIISGTGISEGDVVKQQVQ